MSEVSDAQHPRHSTWLPKQIKRLKAVNKHNLQTFKEQPWREMSGAFGDIGTFIPIFIALASVDGSYQESRLISVSSTLVFSGLANVLTGIWFGVPLPVQPMKAIAAVAIAKNMHSGYQQEFGAGELASAGLFVASVVALLSLTGALQWFTRTIPVPVVKGIQVGAGISLAMSAWGKLDLASDWVSMTGGAILLTVLLYLAMSSRLPFTLLLVSTLAILAIVIATMNWIADGSSPVNSADGYFFSLWSPFLSVPEPSAFLRGALNAGLGQIPLTTLNSIVAVVSLAQDLFPDLPASQSALTATEIGTSVAAMNLIGCWFHAMPVCHGSGGLAAQYRFGARSGASIIFLGCLKLILGLFFSDLTLVACENFPDLLLALLLFLAGQELVKMGESLNTEAARDLWVVDEDPLLSDVDGSNQDINRGEEVNAKKMHFKSLTTDEKIRRWTVMTATVAALLGARNDGVGFMVGMVVDGIYRTQDWRERRRQGQIRLVEEQSEEQERATRGQTTSTDV